MPISRSTRWIGGREGCARREDKLRRRRSKTPIDHALRSEAEMEASPPTRFQVTSTHTADHRMKTRLVHFLLALSLGTGALIAAPETDSARGAESAVKRWECCALTHDGAEVLGDEKLAAKIMD